jgi:glutathione-regulated potassium-efflux system ancillary protein KefG
MLPLKRTATLCGMRWLPPFAVQGTNHLSAEDLKHAAQHLSSILLGLAEGSIDPALLGTMDRLNDIPQDPR